jgi:hypothetical protein
MLVAAGSTTSRPLRFHRCEGTNALRTTDEISPLGRLPENGGFGPFARPEKWYGLRPRHPGAGIFDERARFGCVRELLQQYVDVRRAATPGVAHGRGPDRVVFAPESTQLDLGYPIETMRTESTRRFCRRRITRDTRDLQRRLRAMRERRLSTISREKLASGDAVGSPSDPE